MVLQAAQRWHDRQMLFADVALARRIEEAECRLVVDLAESVGGHRGCDEVLVAPLGGGAAVFTGAGSPVTKLAGLGFAGSRDP